MKFGTYIRNARETRPEGRLSLRHVARLLEIEPSYLSKIERNDVPPFSSQKIIDLAKILGIDHDELLARAGRISPDLEAIIQSKPKLLARLLRQIKHMSDDAIIHLVREVKDGEW